MQQISDRDLIDAYLEEPSFRKAAARLGISNEAVTSRLIRMRIAGVNITRKPGKTTKFTPEYVEELNAYIKAKQS